MGPSGGSILASFWCHFGFILVVFGVLKKVPLYCCRTNDLTAIYSTFVGSAGTCQTWNGKRRVFRVLHVNGRCNENLSYPQDPL